MTLITASSAAILLAGSNDVLAVPWQFDSSCKGVTPEPGDTMFRRQSVGGPSALLLAASLHIW